MSTLGEKIKDTRKEAGLTQEELANKLMVSRQAVTKWETETGLPDIENLKLIAQLLSVSVDYLLNDGETVEKSIIKEAIDLSKYGKQRKKGIKDHIVREKFPKGTIHTLVGLQKSTKGEKRMDLLLLLLTDTPSGILDLINSLKNLDKEFYLVSQENKQFFVKVTDEFIESRQMVQKVLNQKKETFEIGEFQFINCGPIAPE
ncbi:helix-turn-helix domain-containing protein [Enterococcus olivae]